MKKTIKVFVILALVVGMLAGMAAVASAAPQEDSGRQRDAKALTRLFVLYDSDNLDTYLELKQEHKAFHEGRKGKPQAVRQKAADELNALIDALIAGEMTLEEAQEAFEAYRDKIEDFREALSDIRDEKRDENEPIKDSLEDVREQIREALGAEEVDEALMADLLGQTLALLNEHLQLDYDYAQQMDDLVDEYFPE